MAAARHESRHVICLHVTALMTPEGLQDGQLSEADGELDLEQFERAVRLRLQHYSGRVLAKRMTVARTNHGG